MKLLVNYPWPGNVRELQNVIQQEIIIAEDILLPEHLPFYIKENKVGADFMSAQAKAKENLVGADFTFARIEEGKRIDLTEGLSLKEIISRLSKDKERGIILKVLKRTKGNKAEAARLLKINYKTLYLKIKEYGLHPSN